MMRQIGRAEYCPHSDIREPLTLTSPGAPPDGAGRASDGCAAQVALPSAAWDTCTAAGMLARLLLVLGAASLALGAFSIADFGAVPNLITTEAAAGNAAALQKAFAAANASTSGDRTVLVPAGNFTILNATMTGLVGITFEIEGTLLLSANRSAWPQVWNDGGSWGALQFEQCSQLTIVGTGPNVHVNGQGYDWWWCASAPSCVMQVR